MSATSRITSAVRGRCSQMRSPDTLVLIVPNWLRTSLGASGLGSKVSRWLGPPSSQMRMHEVALVPPTGAEAAALACKRNRSVTVKPKVVSKPKCRKSRRDTPSQRQREEMQLDFIQVNG